MIIVKDNCRLCQKNVGTLPLEHNLSEIVEEIARIDVNSFLDFLPTSICLQCSNRLLDINSFIKEIRSVDKYLRSCLQQYLENKSTLNEEIIKPKALNQTTCHVCPVCSKSYNRLPSYKKHTKTHLELYCAKCNTYFNESLESRSHKCETNVKKRKAQKKIKNEIKTDFETNAPPQEVNDRPFHCTKCEQSFVDKNSYSGHQKSHNNYLCSEENCFKVYTTAYSLKIHKLVHEGKRSFLCVICGKDFISKKSLICHEKIHATVKAHRCDSCNLSFSVRSNLRAHIKKYHEGVRYHCSKCPKEFLTKCNLDRHEKIHTGIREFKCANCTSEFYTEKELLKHQRYHQGLKQHKCEQCFKTFFERHHLIIHLRSHSGERPYVCEISNCGKSFYDSQKLKRHKKSIHIFKNDSIL